MLDEPTNHLDIPSRESLEEALEAYEGTIITISHDRFFLDRVATQILALDGEGNSEHYNGDYTEYHDWKAGRSAAPVVADGLSLETDQRTLQGPGRKTKSAPRSVSGGSRSSNDKSRESKRVKIIKKPRDPMTIEAEITELEKHIAELSAEMTKPEVARDITRLVQVNDNYQQAEARLAELMAEWERAESTIPSSRR